MDEKPPEPPKKPRRFTEAEMNARLDNIGKAREAIVKACGGPWKKGAKGCSGAINCPVCSKPDALAFSRSGYNGHIHARCSTEGCVSWME